MNKTLELLNKMTLEEKVGQLIQVGTSIYTEDDVINDDIRKKIKGGKIGSFLSVTGIDKINELQRIAIEESRLGIPLFFAHDIIHGYRTIFPVPTGEACSFEPELAYESCKVSAAETRASGIQVTWAPMVDIARDQRWGRGLEGAGEDVYLSCEFAKARVKGFQNSDLSSDFSVAACAKHLVAYGAVEGGRDYNDVDISDNKLYNTYLPTFKACIDADVEFIMTAFNTLNGIPCTGNKELLQDITRKQMGFDGIFISDAGSLGQLETHGYAKDSVEVAKLGLEAGLDIEMMSDAYELNLKQVAESDEKYLKLLDKAVYRVLKLKEKLGLFENPYVDSIKSDKALIKPQYLDLAQEIAKRSMVLLENNGVLPLKNKNIALIGGLADSKTTMLGKWVCAELQKAKEYAVTILEAFRDEQEVQKFAYSKGYTFFEDGNLLNENLKSGKYEIFQTDENLINESINVAQKADIIVFVAGESNVMNGESKSRADISIPDVQMKIFRKLKKLGKPIITLVIAGRPLILNELKENSDALIFTYNLGTRMGSAVADVIFGRYNPSAKLVNTFPSANGQCPTMYYAHNNTGKPNNPDLWYTSKYIDVPTEPLYPFGYGKSYTNFLYNELTVNKKTFKFDEKIELSVSVTNNGDYDGEEVVQVYMRDLVGKTVRPVKELIAFKKVMLKIGETKQINFEIDCNKLGYYYKREWITEPGMFLLYVGGNSKETLQKEIEVIC